VISSARGGGKLLIDLFDKAAISFSGQRFNADCLTNDKEREAIAEEVWIRFIRSGWLCGTQTYPGYI